MVGNCEIESECLKLITCAIIVMNESAMTHPWPPHVIETRMTRTNASFANVSNTEFLFALDNRPS